MSKSKHYFVLGSLTIFFTILFMSSFSINALADALSSASDASPGAPPFALSKLTANAASVKAPGTITFDATFSGDTTQIDVASFQFVGENTKNKLYASYMPAYSQEISLEIDAFAKSDTYILSQVTISDTAGNSYYYKHAPTSTEAATFQELSVSLSFSVENETVLDATPPSITNVTSDVAEVSSSETITLTPTIEETDSGLDYATFCFENETTKKRLYITATEENRTPSLTLSTFQVPGLYTLVEISAADLAGNRVYYVSTYKSTDPSFFQKLPCTLSFTVKNPNFDTFSQNSETANLSNDIDLLPETGRILIDCTNYEEIPASVFKSAKNTEKTLCFYKDSEIWTIRGKDITEIMDFEPSSKLSRPAEDTTSLLVTFPSFDKFPGTFTFQLNIDSVFDIDDEALAVITISKYDEKSGQQSAGDSVTPDTDGYISLQISHPSDLLIEIATSSENETTDTTLVTPQTGPLDDAPVFLWMMGMNLFISAAFVLYKKRISFKI